MKNFWVAVIKEIDMKQLVVNGTITEKIGLYTCEKSLDHTLEEFLECFEKGFEFNLRADILKLTKKSDYNWYPAYYYIIFDNDISMEVKVVNMAYNQWCIQPDIYSQVFRR